MRDVKIIENLDLVRMVALKVKRGLPHGFDLEDLMSAGTIGLIRAVDSFNGTGSFRMYACQRVRFAILDSIRRKQYADVTHLPLSSERHPAAMPDLDAEIDKARLVRRAALATDALTWRAQEILSLLYSNAEPSHSAVARELHRSRNWIAESHKNSIAKLREHLNNETHRRRSQVAAL